MAIKCRRELLGGLYTGINTQHITMSSKMVQLCLFSFFFCFFFIFCLFQVTGNFMHFCKYSAYSRYKSTVDFMYNHIKLLSVPMPLHMKVEFIR